MGNVQDKRNKYDYRGKYIQHNPGLFGGIYICSQCHCVMHRGEMQVDHIFPISKIYGINRVFNCVSICPTCNKLKSNKVTKNLIIKGLIAKFFEELYINIQRVIILLARLIIILGKLIPRIIITPLISNKGVVRKISIILLYVIFIFYVKGVLKC